MRIGVDCHVISGKFQGSRTYFLNLYSAVLAIDNQNEYFFFGHWDNKTPFGQKANYVEFPTKSRWKRLTYQTYNLLIKHEIDLYHTNYISPFLLPCKSLVTIHDILYETHPSYFTKREVFRNRLLVKISAKRAAQIHTVSEYSKKNLLDIYKLSNKEVRIVPNGVDLVKFSPDNRDDISQQIENKFGIKDYILTVGRLEPRKNHVGLLHAYAKLVQKYDAVGPLVIVGQKDFGNKNLFITLNELNISDRVVILENIDDDLLSSIIRVARLFVYPSFAEGFGIPPLEAMACGVPVITSNKTAIPEVVGNAGILVDPSDYEMIYEAMYKVISEATLARELSIAGRAQAEKWSWQNAAIKYIESLKELN